MTLGMCRVATPLFTSATGSYLGATVDEPAGGPRACPSGVPAPERGDSSSPDRLTPGTRPGSAWWACSCPPTMLPGGRGPRRVAPAPPRGPLNRPPCHLAALLPPAGQALRCSARAVAGNTQSRRQVSNGDAARGRPSRWGTQPLGKHAQPAWPPWGRLVAGPCKPCSAGGLPGCLLVRAARQRQARRSPAGTPGGDVMA